MTLWFVLVVLCAAAAVFVALPFLRPRADAAPATDATEILKAELAQVDIDQAVGEIDADSADAARLEAQRRLLAAADAPKAAAAQPSLRTDRVTAAVVVATVVLGAVALYAQMGKPNVPSAVPGGQGPAEPQMASAAAGPAAPASAMQGLPDVDTEIARLEQRLKSQPNDVEGWKTLGWANFETQKYPEAVAAYAQAVKLSPTTAALQSAYGEALDKAAGGQLTSDAKQAFQAALKLDPADKRARVYLGLETAAAAPAPTPQDVQAAAAMPTGDQQTMINGMVDKQVRDLATNPKDADGWVRLIRSRKVLGQPDLARQALQSALAAFTDDPTTQSQLRSAARDSA